MAFVCPCPLCKDARHLKFDRRDFVKHLRLFHVHQPGFKVPCMKDGCPRTFTNLRTFENHLSTAHTTCTYGSISSEMTVEQREDSEDNRSSCDSSEDIFDDVELDDNNDDQCLDDATENPCISQDLMQRSSVLFLLNLKEKYKLTQAAIQGIIAGFTDIAEQQISFVKSQVRTYILSS